MDQNRMIVYCTQHMAPHDTVWCTVAEEDKIPLDAKTMEEAVEECKQKGYKLYQP